MDGYVDNHPNYDHLKSLFFVKLEIMSVSNGKLGFAHIYQLVSLDR